MSTHKEIGTRTPAKVQKSKLDKFIENLKRMR